MTKHATQTLEELAGSDIIDIRDVIARIEELEAERDSRIVEDDEQAAVNAEIEKELATLNSFVAQAKGNSGDEQWRGDWYPIAFIRDSYFQEYAEELADDIGATNKNARWPLNHIDWENAAEELKGDYVSYEFEGETYWAR